MYPNPVVFGHGLYEIFIAVGIVACLLVFRFYISKAVPNRLFNFYLVLSILAITLGFVVFAPIFQAFFDFLKTGKFNAFNSGITFYGGLVGGIFTFLALLFIGGELFFKQKEHLLNFKYVLRVAPMCVTIAHAFGRIGCLFAGCCHGRVTSGFGITMYVDELSGYYKCVPLQLYEAIFLFILFGVLTCMYFKNIHFEIEMYCIAYGVWRFIIEFFRDDDRGSLIAGVLTPSQGFALIFIIFGTALFFYRNKIKL